MTEETFLATATHIQSEEQTGLAASVKGFAARYTPLSDTRAEYLSHRGGYKRNAWEGLIDLGLPSLATPESLGGMGGGLDDLVGPLQELGRNLYAGPLLSTIGLAVPLLLNAAHRDETAQRLLDDIGRGNRIATVGFMNDLGEWPSAQVVAAGVEGAWRLSGSLHLVLDADLADTLLVCAWDASELSLFAVDMSRPEVESDEKPSIDPSRHVFTVTLENIEAERLDVLSAERVLASTIDYGAVVLAAEQVGLAKACLDMSLAYGNVRHQFGSPIGSFQAIQHKCAESRIAIDAAEAAVLYAAWAHREMSPEFPIAASVAQAAASDAALFAASENIQIHGSIGCTFEHDAHLFFRRAKWSLLYLGTPEFHRSRICDLLGV